MRLTYEQFKAKLAQTKVAIKKAMTAAAPKTAGKKPSQTKLRRWRRARRTAPRAVCDSFRYKQKHQHELRAVARREQDNRRNNRLTPASSSLRKFV